MCTQRIKSDFVEFPMLQLNHTLHCVSVCVFGVWSCGLGFLMRRKGDWWWWWWLCCCCCCCVTLSHYGLQFTMISTRVKTLMWAFVFNFATCINECMSECVHSFALFSFCIKECTMYVLKACSMNTIVCTVAMHIYVEKV